MGAPVSAVLIALEALTLISIWIMLYQLMKQQGRILLRLDALADDGLAEHMGETRSSTGLAVGTAFPSFSFPDLAGQTIALEDFLGKRVLLVNWSPQCGFCDLIAPDLSKLQPDFLKENVQLLLLSQGTAGSDGKLAQEHGLVCPILLMKGAQAPEPFQSLGTPAAYLLDEQGKVAKAVAVGAEQVPALARESVGQSAGSHSKKKRLRGERALGESRIERNGLKPGTPAPSFQLPDIHGNRVSLEEYRGRRVLLVFSDPHCGPCDELAPQLARLHQEHRDNNLAIIMVGRGDAEENRNKAERHGVEFPVVLQDQWKLSKEYGIFATPVAFLIGEDGLIKKTVAKGVEEILALAPQAVASETLRKGA